MATMSKFGVIVICCERDVHLGRGCLARALFPRRRAPVPYRIDTAWMALDGPSRPAYANMLDSAPASLMPAVYGAHYERLVRLKARFDPANRFHGDANIEPGPA
jgi:hypothetical protein